MENETNRQENEPVWKIDQAPFTTPDGETTTPIKETWGPLAEYDQTEYVIV